MKKNLLLLSLVLLVRVSFGQSITSWTKTTNIPNSEEQIYDVIQLPDTGYILAGSVRTAAKVFSDYFLIRTDKIGDTLWTKRWGSTAGDAVTAIAARPGGGYVVAGGNSWSFAFLDNNGNVVTTHTVTGHSFTDVTVLQDSGFIFTGYFGGYPISSDVSVVRVNKNGNTVWAKTYGTIRADIGRAIAPTSDGNFVVAGHANFQSFADGSYIPQLAYILKINNAGDTLWTDTISTTVISRSDATDILENKIGEYVICGSGLGSDAMLAAWSATGNLNWHKLLVHNYNGTGPNPAIFYNLEQKCDGGYVATGYFQTASGYRGLVASTDIGGDTLFMKAYGQSVIYLKSIIPTLDGGFFMGGFNGSQNYSVNACAVKLDAQAGNSTQGPIISNFTSTLSSNTVTFTEKAIGALHWQWNFGDGNLSSLKNPVHTYLANGTYTVCLKVWNFCDTVSLCKVLSPGSSTVTLIGENEALTKLQIYPSPAVEFINVSYKCGHGGTVSFRIFDLAGKEIGNRFLWRVEVGENLTKIDISGLEDGMYFIETVSNGEIKQRNKVVKVR